MSAKILSPIKIGNNHYYHLTGCYFTKDSIEFKIVGTESTGPGIHDVTHTIKNLNSKTYANIPMPKLIKILLDCD
jgi:hypothetical protein